MNAESLALALLGHRVGNTWMARCPAHEDREPSLSIQDAESGKILVHCHAGCTQEAVIAELRSRSLWCKGISYRTQRTSDRSVKASISPARLPVSSSIAHRLIWNATFPAQGTPVEHYLRTRGIRIEIPPTIRFHPGLKHPQGVTCPAMVALVCHGLDGQPVAIHRTFLDPRGSGKASVAPQKMMLGPCRGGVTRLGTPDGVLMVGEGLETCLSALQAADIAAWAALSTSGLLRLELPGDIREVIVLADGDDAGEAAARGAARRWSLEGRKVRIAHAPPGLDFNDLLCGRSKKTEGG